RFDENIPEFAEGDLSSFGTVHAAVETFWHVYREYRAEWKAITQAATVEPDLLELWMRVRDQGIKRVAPLVQAAQKQGLPVKELDTMLVASNLSAMVEHT